MHILDANTALLMSAKPVSYTPNSARLLDQLREVLRFKHYSLRTQEASADSVSSGSVTLPSASALASAMRHHRLASPSTLSVKVT